MVLAGGAGIVFLGGSTGIFGFIFVIVGAIMLLIGLVELVIFWGLWTGKSWARFLAIIFAILGILFNLMSVVGGGLTAIVGLLIGVVILWYLFQPQVKAFYA
jgi:uncharacterized membrane protein (DUF2068 family)